MEKILHYLKNRSRNTIRTHIYTMSENSNCKTADVRKLLEQIERDNMGMFTAYRKNKREFFVWFYEPKAVAEYLLGELKDLQDHKTCIKQVIEYQVGKELQNGTILSGGTSRELVLDTLEDS